MSKADTKPVQVVDGEVVRGSTVLWVIVIALSILTALGGVGILLSGWTEIAIGRVIISEYPFLVGAGLVAAGLLLLVVGVHKLREGGRLVLGADRLQFVTARGRVLTQIPYRNILELKLVDVQLEMGIVSRRIHIHLHDTNDPETLVEHGSIYKEHHGCDCMFDPHDFVLPADRLHERMQAHIQKFQTGH
jgi:hypothetical protein